MTCHSRWKKSGRGNPLFWSNAVKAKRHLLHFWLLHWLYKTATVSKEQSEMKGAPFHFYSIDAKLPIVVKINWIFVWVVPQLATSGALWTQQKIVLCNFTVGTYTKMFLLIVTLQSMIFPYWGRSSTRNQAIVLSLSDKTMCKVLASVICYK